MTTFNQTITIGGRPYDCEFKAEDKREFFHLITGEKLAHIVAEANNVYVIQLNRGCYSFVYYDAKRK